MFIIFMHLLDNVICCQAEVIDVAGNAETSLATVSHQPKRLDNSAKLSPLSKATLDSPPEVSTTREMLPAE
jgi:hypothetical protein